MKSDFYIILNLRRYDLLTRVHIHFTSDNYIKYLQRKWQISYCWSKAMMRLLALSKNVLMLTMDTKLKCFRHRSLLFIKFNCILCDATNQVVFFEMYSWTWVRNQRLLWSYSIKSINQSSILDSCCKFSNNRY